VAGGLAAAPAAAEPPGTGDVNGDGVADVLLAHDGVRVVFGRRSPGTVDLGALGDGGYRISGVSAQTVHSVAAAGDIDGDGRADLALVDYGSNDARLVLGSAQRDFDFRSPGARALRMDTADGVERIVGRATSTATAATICWWSTAPARRGSSSGAAAGRVCAGSRSVETAPRPKSVRSV
jgi:hypothetical protein